MGAPPPRGRAAPRETVPPPVWLVVWVAVATEWLRGYMGGMFFGAKIILAPRTRRHIYRTGLLVRSSTGQTVDTTDLDCQRYGPRTRTQQGALAASELLFPAIGAAAAGWLTRHAGRRTTTMIGIGLMCVGQLMAGVTAEFLVYIVGADIYTSGSCIVIQAMVLEVLEVVPSHCRGRLFCLRSVGSTVGFSMAALVVLAIKLADQGLAEWRWGFRLSLLLGMWPAAMLMCFVPWMLDTPSSLLQRGRLHEARQALQSLRGEFSDVREEYEAAARAVSEGKGKGQLKLLRARPQRPALILITCLGLLAGVMDPSWIIEPDTNVFGATAALSRMPFLYTTLLPSASSILGAIACCLFVDRAGRRRLAALSAAAVVPLSLTLAALMARHAARRDGGGGDKMESQGGAMLLMLYLNHLITAIGWLSNELLIAAELLPVNVRSAGVALHMVIRILVYRGLHHLMLHRDCSAQAAAFAAHGATAAVGAVFAWFLLPETAGAPLEGVSRECTYAHRAWRRFAPQQAAPDRSASLAKSASQNRGGGAEGRVAACGAPPRAPRRVVATVAVLALRPGGLAGADGAAGKSPMQQLLDSLFGAPAPAAAADMMNDIPPEYRVDAPSGHGSGWVHSHIANRLATAGREGGDH
ncbi:MAG: hypothetical protein J3K34DRAFT_518004 [Monoraphidium minutum]|nr:MAG: hypothetical protein J3K34DRAFT_518004 [Monoraphidium minutum]